MAEPPVVVRQINRKKIVTGRDNKPVCKGTVQHFVHRNSEGTEYVGSILRRPDPGTGLWTCLARLCSGELRFLTDMCKGCQRNHKKEMEGDKGTAMCTRKRTNNTPSPQEETTTPSPTPPDDISPPPPRKEEIKNKEESELTQIKDILLKSISDNQNILTRGLDRIVTAIKETRVEQQPPPPPNSPLVEDRPFTQAALSSPDRDSEIPDTESEDSSSTPPPRSRRPKNIKRNKRKERDETPPREKKDKKKIKREGAPTPPVGICMNMRDKAYMVKYSKGGVKSNKNFSKHKFGSYEAALEAAVRWRQENLG